MNSKNSHFQNVAKCKTFVLKMSFICMGMKNHFHINGFAVSLALKQRLGAKMTYLAVTRLRGGGGGGVTLKGKWGRGA